MQRASEQLRPSCFQGECRRQGGLGRAWEWLRPSYVQGECPRQTELGSVELEGTSHEPCKSCCARCPAIRYVSDQTSWHQGRRFGVSLCYDSGCWVCSLTFSPATTGLKSARMAKRGRDGDFQCKLAPRPVFRVRPPRPASPRHRPCDSQTLCSIRCCADPPTISQTRA